MSLETGNKSLKTLDQRRTILKKASYSSIKNERCEHHSNLALATTVVAMVCFVVLMFIYMSSHNPGGAVRPSEISVAGAVISWITAAILAYNSVRKGKKYLLEYIVLLLVFGLGLFVMYDRPGFIRALVEGTYFQSNWARGIFKIVSVCLVAYSLVSIAWHIILATPRKSKKK